MTTNGQEEIKSPLQLLYDAVRFLHSSNDPLVYEVMVRAINNYVFLRANSNTANGELNSDDMKKILFRIGQDTHEVLPLKLGLDTFRPKPRTEHVALQDVE